ncbi:MAG: DUF3927 family protein [Pseudoalteromonas sp.]
MSAKIKFAAVVALLLMAVAVDFVSSIMSILVDLGLIAGALAILWPLIKEKLKE